jgi:aryl-alcohol dehydrogenase
MREIKAAVAFGQSGDFSIEQLELSEPGDNEVLVRITATGICHTDPAGRDSTSRSPHPRAYSDTKGLVSSKRWAQG